MSGPESFEERVEAVRARVAAACARAGRDPAGVEILAAAKNQGPDQVREAAAAGLHVVGENRVQEAAQKIPLCPGGLEWHLIGHLQTNKARHAVRLFQTIHSVDSERLIEALDEACDEEGVALPLFLEINVSGERSKWGFAPEAGLAALRKADGWRRIMPAGLMTVPPFTPDPEGARPYFKALRELRERWRDETGLGLEHLSMGMSGDFEVAIEEGATLVRLGTVLFGPRVSDWRRAAADEADA